VEIMTASNVFLALLEYGSAEVGTALFADQGVPMPRASEFSPNALQRRLSGQAGWQRFFTVNSRPFCAYVVIGSARNVGTLSALACSALSTLRIEGS
jgi:hypothetical protein